MYVAPAARGRGVARALLGALVAHARRRGSAGCCSRPAPSSPRRSASTRARAGGPSRPTGTTPTTRAPAASPSTLRVGRSRLRVTPHRRAAGRAAQRPAPARADRPRPPASGRCGRSGCGTTAARGPSVVLSALADTADPDLAVTALERLVRGGRGPELLPALRTSAGLRDRLLARARRQQRARRPPGRRTRRTGGCWTTTTCVDRRPSLLGLQPGCWAPSAPPLPGPDGVARGARAPGREVLAALRAEYRRCLLELAARDLAGALALEDVAGELADLAAADPDRRARRRPRRAARRRCPSCRLAVIAHGQDRRPRAQLRQRRRRRVRGRGRRRSAATALASGMVRVCGEVAWPVDAGAAARGQGRPAGAHAWPATRPTTAAGRAPGSSRRCSRPGRSPATWPSGGRTCDAVAPLVWSRGRAARTSSRTCRPCGAGSRRRSRATRPTASSSSAPAGCATSSSPCSCCSWSTAAPTTPCAAARRWSRCEQLADGGYVGREDARHLAEAYRWLRTVEHRLQLHRLRRTHLLPARRRRGGAAPAGPRRAATAATSLPLFARERAGYGREVRRLHEKLFYRPLLTAVARLPGRRRRG